MSSVKEYIKVSRDQDISNSLEGSIKSLESEGYKVEFGQIGKKTTYALIYKDDDNTEYVGYTFIRDLKYYNPQIGKLRALNQAIARKETLVY